MIAALMIGITGCTDSGDTQDAALADKGFDEAMAMADSLYNSMQFRDAYKLYLQLLDTKEAEADSEKRLSVLNALSNTSELSGNKVEQHKWLQQLHDLAEQTGNAYYQSLAHITMGQSLFYEGSREEGIQNVVEAIDLMAKTDRENTDHLIHGYLNMLASLYGAMQDYDHALQANERNLQLTMQGTRWGAAPNQQLIDRRMALAKMASTLAQMGRAASGSQQDKYYQQADSAYAAWKAIEYEGNHTRDYFIVDYMKKRGRYQEAVAIYNDLIERIRQQGDTLGEMMNTTKWGLAEVYQRMGNGEQAASLYEQVLVIQDTLKSRKARNTAQELAAIYHEKEQQQTIMQQQAENTRQRYLLFIALAVLVGVMALAFVIIRKNRIISQKNRVLAQQIVEALKYKETHPQQTQPQQTHTQPEDVVRSRTKSPVGEGSDYPDDDSADGVSASLPQGEGQEDGPSDEQLFQHIHDVIMREQLYLDPAFGRQTIIDRFQLSKERVGAVFAQGSDHSKLSNYIQQLRLEHAAKLLIEQPDQSIVQIASDSGFARHNYFSLCFRRHFGMSPSEFRDNALRSDDE